MNLELRGIVHQGTAVVENVAQRTKSWGEGIHSHTASIGIEVSSLEGTKSKEGIGGQHDSQAEARKLGQ